jgi:hypothetical protein
MKDEGRCNAFILHPSSFILETYVRTFLVTVTTSAT